MSDDLRITIPAGEAPRHPFGDLNRGKKKQPKPVTSAKKEKEGSAKGKKEPKEEASTPTPKTGGRVLNAYFKAMLDAKRSNKNSFTYNGNTYKKQTTSKGLITYKKA